MKIRKANARDFKQALKIAGSLQEWFTKQAIKNMQIDFKINNLVVAIDKNKVIGFLCYNSYEGFVQLIWMGIARSYQRKGIGTLLLKWLVKFVKSIGSKAIEVETLPATYKYKPYEQTRAFYKKHGFSELYIKPPKRKGWDKQVVMEKKL